MPGTDQPEYIDHDEQVTAVVRDVVPMSELANFFDRSFGELARVLAEQGVTPRSAAFALYRRATSPTWRWASSPTRRSRRPGP